MLSQPYVFRLFFATELEAVTAHKQLSNAQLRSDYIKSVDNNEPGRWKLIFTDIDLDNAKREIRNLGIKPNVVEVYDPAINDIVDPWKSLV